MFNHCSVSIIKLFHIFNFNICNIHLYSSEVLKFVKLWQTVLTVLSCYTVKCFAVFVSQSELDVFKRFAKLNAFGSRKMRDLEFCLRQTTNGRNDHVTMFTPYLPLVVFSSSVKLSSFALASKVRTILHYSPLCTIFCSRKYKHEPHVCRLP